MLPRYLRAAMSSDHRRAPVVQNGSSGPRNKMMKIDPAIVRRLREQRAWSQEQLAEIAGVSVRTVQRVETGGSGSLDTRMALAAALEVAPAALCAPGTGDDGALPTLPADGLDERIFRRYVVAIGFAIVFALSLLVGYLVSRDFAAKENRRDCIAAGRSDCR